jgi:uncharacterized protein (DUF433 family)
VVIDPSRSYGRPILARRGIPIAVIAERLMAGESHDLVMKDFKLMQEELEEAIRWQLRDAA